MENKNNIINFNFSQAKKSFFKWVIYNKEGEKIKTIFDPGEATTLHLDPSLVVRREYNDDVFIDTDEYQIKNFKPAPFNHPSRGRRW